MIYFGVKEKKRHSELISTTVPNNFTDKYVQRRVVVGLEFAGLCPDNNFLIRLQS